MIRSTRLRPAAVLCAAIVLAALSAPVRAAGTGRAPPAPQADRFLGFEIGEEVRYVLGPPEALLRGETGMWSIRLDEIYAGEDGAPQAVFALQHEWQAPRPIGDPPLRAIMRVASKGTLRVNAYGFPLALQHETVRHLAGYGDQAYTIDYTLDEDHRRYEKRTTMDGDRWYESVPVRNDDRIDRDAPAGLFAFLPEAPGCLDRFVSTYQGQGAMPQPNSAAGQPQGVPTTVRVVDNEDCEESLFANPGLLTLAMPALWEAQGERDYVFFTPVGAVGRPRTSVGVGVPGGTGAYPPGIGPGSTGGFPARRNDAYPISASTYDEVETLRFVERVSVRIGSRTIEAWYIEMSDDAGPVYVDDDGVVVRIDLPPPAQGAERYVRRLWPSEF